jgi:small-conductance mechanosensitive channel
VAVADYGAATGELYQAILEAFRAKRIVIPVPQRDVRVLSSAAYLAGQRPEERFAGRDAA